MNVNTVRKWAREQEVRGNPVFTMDALKKAFPEHTLQCLLNALMRLKRDNIVYSPYKSFYVVIPSQYALRGAVPPYFYIDALMKHLNRNYYFGLLSAALLWGSSHQKPQSDFVFTTLPKIYSPTKSKRDIKWIYKNAIPTRFLCEKPGEAGPVVYSNAELTAIDLVQYESQAGGLSVVATILSELIESTDFANASEGVFKLCSTPCIQRLGYLIDTVIGDKRQGETIYSELRKLNSRIRNTALSSRSEPSGEVDEKWKVILNTQIEIDDL